MAKKYRLLKDLPTFKAGEEFFISDSGNLIAGTPSDPKQITVETRYGLPMKIDLMAYAKETLEQFPNILTDWFEEIQELKKYYYIGSMGHVESAGYKGWEVSLKLRKSISNYFETEEEAEKYLKYLKAKVVIKRDTKGFKPDWENDDEKKYLGFWDFDEDGLDWLPRNSFKEAFIYFKSREDIEESFKKHPEEWKTYLNYEQ
jgi:hypothetical protein|nr:MAG TPA: hypothetical protein [Caudoviricetes sp.]